ncbi:MAG TPA: AAA family ATPase, partial [Kofleriaceae bacterium]|nr:AAA family ATPase [Kofleriaceae bacterium]
SVGGMRCIDGIKLDLGELTVLIGENGAGKSTIVEAAELLRKAATMPPFVDRLYQLHDGTRLFRSGAERLRLGARVEGAGPPLDYELVVLRDGAHLSIDIEIAIEADTRIAMSREGAAAGWPAADAPEGQAIRLDHPIGVAETLLGGAQFLGIAAAERLQRALAAIEVHVPLDLRTSWATPQVGATARSSNLARPVERLDPGGTNLANVYARLKNQPNWRETLGRLRLVFGEVDDVLIQPDPSGGTIGLEVRWESGLEVPLSGLSDGQVSMLALLAIQQLRRKVPPSLIVIDEPEAHLHPGVIRRVAAGLSETGDEWPVLVATQSDAFLDAISDRLDAFVHCRLDAQRRTELSRLDRANVQGWLDEFRGVGELRREGLEDLAFPPVS